MKLAVYHNLPSGGALRVLESYLRLQGEAHHIELFLPDTANDEFVPLSPLATTTHRFPAPIVAGKLGNFTQLRGISRMGQKIANHIDSGGFDAVLVSASQFTQAPEILPFVKTPTLYYAPEYNRALYDRVLDSALTPAKQHLREAVLAPRRAWIKRFDRQSIRAANRIFAHSQFAAKRLHDVYGVTPAVVYLGVDTDLYSPQHLAREPFVLSVGALHPVKGHQFVIAALASLPEAARPSLVLIGDRGDYGEELRRLAEAAGVKLSIKQQIPFAEVVSLYNRATVLAAAQYQEPFGLITLEAMACETPVVAVAEGGLRETISDGVTGILTSRQETVFGQALQKFFDDPTTRQKIGQQGRADVEQRWQWRATTTKIESLLQEVSGGR